MTEHEIEQLLKQMADEGKLLDSLTDENIDTILDNAPDVKVSDTFHRRAMLAMNLAQLRRKQGIKFSQD